MHQRIQSYFMKSTQGINTNLSMRSDKKVIFLFVKFQLYIVISKASFQRAQIGTLHEKRPETVNRKSIVFHYNNAKAHTSSPSNTIMGWGVSPCTPDIAPSDFLLFQSLQNPLIAKRSKDVKLYFVSTDTKSQVKGILTLGTFRQNCLNQPMFVVILLY